jgi:hypothetical protein
LRSKLQAKNSAWMLDFWQLTKSPARGDTDRAMNTTAVTQGTARKAVPVIPHSMRFLYNPCTIVENNAFTPAFGAV